MLKTMVRGGREKMPALVMITPMSFLAEPEETGQH